MSEPRKAHSVDVIDRRLSQYQSAGVADVMELVGLYDELARVERKRREKTARLKAGGKADRPLANAAQHNVRLERLKIFVAAALRHTPQTGEASERFMLERVARELGQRSPVDQSNQHVSGA